MKIHQPVSPLAELKTVKKYLEGFPSLLVFYDMGIILGELDPVKIRPVGLTKVGCCRRLIERANSSSPEVLCLKLVLPVRLVAFGLIAGNGAYIIQHLDSIDVIITVITIITQVLALTMLRECSRSVLYHRELKALDRGSLPSSFRPETTS
ncbi:MAG: hypothetical protein KJ950_00935 [Proteobacteria bacterium]|nr:hypothetical protein [Pseudomonadota bacterium]MBU1687867.1 hypothetical protein [Pseudomonadota bacterium]